MAVSLRSVRDAALVVVMLTVPVLMLRSATRAPHELGPLDRALRRIGAPLEAAISYSAGMVGAFFERWVLQARLQEQNAVLRGENRELKLELGRLRALEEENRQLRKALKMRDKASEDLLVAERVGGEQSPFFRVVSVRIDRGRAMVLPQMPVVSADGVVGRVDKTFDEYSDVMLITDPRSRIAVELPRSRAQGILRGEGEDGCSVRVPKDFEVKVGDLVQTSGVDELFPKGYPVGQVVTIEEQVGDEQLLHVLPLVRFDKLDVMWVVLARAPAPDPQADAGARAVRARGLQPVR